ncbi:Arc family DNA-binding protein [Jiella sp. M17.18]|uniref:FitA-like ribbon-helix-helix domain-containing protein n=1 Tax=Jiella sp. M17.18 TaxID=3234247 RepID=UPI0034DFB24D
MGQMLVRQIDDALLERLKTRARQNGRSAEAEARAILAEALAVPATPRSLMSLIGAGSSRHSFRTSEEIMAHVRALREEGDR